MERSIRHVRANLSRVCHADRNCIIIISETRNRDREFRAKNLNFQISSVLCVVGEIFYDYRECCIFNVPYTLSSNTNIEEEGKKYVGGRG